MSESLDQSEAERSNKPKPPGYVPERGETFTVVDDTEAAIEHLHEVTAWSSRIPAAIARAETVYLALPPRHSGKVTWYATYIEGTTDIKDVITATEVALAKALWMEVELVRESVPYYPHHRALIDFTEKVESLD